MRDFWHDILKLADYHRGLLLGAAVAIVAAVSLFGCDVTTTSLVDPNRKVTARQLQAEVDLLESNLSKRQNQLIAEIATFNDDVDQLDASVGSALDDLQQQYELREQMIRTLGGFAVDAAAGQFNPVSALSTLFSLLSLGAAGGLAVDNFRKGRVIRVLKDNTASATP